MDKAFVQNAQHDVERGQSRQDEHHLVAHRVAEHLGRALKTAHYGGGHAQAHPGGVDGRLRLGKRSPRRQVEGQRHCGKLPLMGYGKRRKGGGYLGHAQQGHQPPRARQAHLFQGLGSGQPVRPVFQHHAVLVLVFIDGGNLALTKGVAQGAVHVLHAQPVAGQGIAVRAD